MAHWHIGNVRDPKLCLYFLFKKCSIWNNNYRLFFWWECEKGIFLRFFWVIRGSLAYDFIFFFALFPDLTRSHFHHFSCMSPTFKVFVLFWYFFSLQLLLAAKCSRILQIHFICVFVFICNASPAAATPHSSQSAIASSMGKHNCEGIQA